MKDPTDIRAWQRLSARFTTSGCLKAEDIAKLAEIGVKRVINLTPDGHPEILPDEDRQLALHGIEYTNIPVSFTDPSTEHFDQFVDELNKDLQPVHVHCVANYRVSAFFYRYHLDTGMPEATARALMEEHWSPDTNEKLTVTPWVRFIRRES